MGLSFSIRSVYAMIITDKPDKICEALSSTAFQISKVRNIVRENDKAAYVTITDVADVV